LNDVNAQLKLTKIRLFLTCWIIFTLHFATNIVREFYPALCLVDNGTLRVDEYEGLHPDIMPLPGKGAFINSNPGASLIAAFPYYVFKPFVDFTLSRVSKNFNNSPGEVSAEYHDHRPNRLIFYKQVRERGLDIKFGLVAFVMVAFCMSPLSALSSVVMFNLLNSQLNKPRLVLGLSFLYAFGTPIFFRTGYINQNLMIAHFCFFSFALLWKPGEDYLNTSLYRLCLSGFLCGLAILCDYSGIIIWLLFYGYVLFDLYKRDGIFLNSLKKSIGFIIGSIAPVGFLLWYQWYYFGNPLFPAQSYMPPTPYTKYGYKGVSIPSIDTIWGNLFDLRYGLFVFCPFLMMSFFTLFIKKQKLTPHREIIFIMIFFITFLLFCSANQYSLMQFNTGVRYMVPLVPFLFLLAVEVFMRIPRKIGLLIAIITLSQSWCISMVRDFERPQGILESIKLLFLQGFQLPWLTVISKTATQYTATLSKGASPILLFLITAGILYCIWIYPSRDQIVWKKKYPLLNNTGNDR